jgi:putative flippase GtrA
MLNARYAASGLLNTLIGFSAIWFFAFLGAAPALANMLGYAVALSIAFLNARSFVFRSEGHLTHEAVRYAGSFIGCYALNLLVLFVCIERLSLPVMVGQAIAVSSYVVTMYLASRLFIFPGGKHGTA